MQSHDKHLEEIRYSQRAEEILLSQDKNIYLIGSKTMPSYLQ